MMASICVVVAALYIVRSLLIPLALAVLLAFLLAPLVHRMERLHLPRTVTIMIVFGLALLLIAGIGWLISYQLRDFSDNVSAYRAEIQHRLKRYAPSLSTGRWPKCRRSISRLPMAPPPSLPPTRPCRPAGPMIPLPWSSTAPSATAGSWKSSTMFSRYLVPRAKLCWLPCSPASCSCGTKTCATG